MLALNPVGAQSSVRPAVPVAAASARNRVRAASVSPNAVAAASITTSMVPGRREASIPAIRMRSRPPASAENRASEPPRSCGAAHSRSRSGPGRSVQLSPSARSRSVRAAAAPVEAPAVSGAWVNAARSCSTQGINRYAKPTIRARPTTIAAMWLGAGPRRVRPSSLSPRHMAPPAAAHSPDHRRTSTVGSVQCTTKWRTPGSRSSR